MRLLSVAPANFLAWPSGQKVSFDPDARLHVVYGPNEAGKSTLLRAILAGLFGVKNSSVDTGSGWKISMKLLLRERGELELSCNPKRFSINDQKWKREEFLSNLKGVNESFYRHFFALGHEDFTRLHQLMKGSKDQKYQEWFFQAAHGSRSLDGLIKRLTESLDELVTSRIDNARAAINRDITSLKEQLNLLEQSRAKPERYPELIRNREEGARRIEEREKTIKSLTGEKTGVENRIEAHDLAIQAVQLDRKIRDTPAARIPTEVEKEWRRLQQQSESKTRSIEEKTGEIQGLEKELAGLKVDKKILDAAECIEELNRKIREIESACEDIPKRENELHPLEAKDAELRRELIGLGLTKENFITELTQHHVNLLQDCADKLELTRNQHEQARRELETRAETLKKAGETVAMGREIELTEMGDLKGRAQALTARWEEKRTFKGAITRHTHDQENLLLRMGCAPEKLESVQTCIPPDPETIEDFRQKFEDAENIIRERKLRVEKLETKLEETRNNLKSSQKKLAETTPESLHAARKERDELLDRFLQSPNKPSHTALVRAVDKADEIADALINLADDVAGLKNSKEKAAEIEQELAEVRAVLEEAGKSKESLQTDWEKLWSGLPFRLRPPGKMWDIPDGVVKLRELSNKIDEARKKLDDLEEDRNSIAAKARALAGQYGFEPPGVDEAPEDLKRLLTREIERLEVNNRNFLSAKTQLNSARDEEENARQELDSKKRAYESALSAYAGQLQKLNFPGNLNGGEAKAAANYLLEYQRVRKEMGALNDRIGKMRRNIEEFEREVDRAVKAAAPDLAMLPHLDAVQQLGERLTKNREDKTRQEEKTSRLEKLRGEHQKLQDEQQEISNKLSRLLGDAGLTSEEARQAVERAETIRNNQTELDRMLDQVGLLLGCERDSALEKAQSLAGEDIAALHDKTKTLEEEISNLKSEQEQAREDLGALKSEFSALEKDTAPPDMGEIVTLQARIEANSREVVVQSLMLELAKRWKERLNENSGSPMLKKAGEYLSVLTGGRYLEVRGDAEIQDQEGHKLFSIVDGDEQEKDISQLSDGSRDQLFLALRLAAIDQHNRASGHEPMPVILDDVLQGFDDERAGYGLRLLAEFSPVTQVIYFTHHRHLLKLAEKHAAVEVLEIQSIPAPGE
ncbi:MAG: Chromosome partition protein Smc [Myxococcota bacterium]|nr:Chromosome partition protein Smc [Myxococcota bacterium]